MNEVRAPVIKKNLTYLMKNLKSGLISCLIGACDSIATEIYNETPVHSYAGLL